MIRSALLVVALACTHAAAADPLKSAECGTALQSLSAARAGGDAPRVEAARAQASKVCLGGGGAAQRPTPVAREPIAVAPPVIVPPEAPRPPVSAPPEPPVAIGRPPVITQCDGGGCWDSEGRRLNRAGPVLIGPHGACTTSGLSVQCP